MSSENEMFDKYLKDQLSADEVASFEERLKTDAAFRQRAEEHQILVKELKSFHERNRVRDVLNEAHQSIEKTRTLTVENTSGWRFWPMAAVAASVAMISIVGTVFYTRSLESKQTAYYKELRRNVDQIQQSQKLIMKDLEKAKKSALPGKYAGTGFLLSSAGYVATSYHVIKEADSIIIENEKFGRLRTTIVYGDPLNDISILKIEGELNLRSLPFAIAESEANLAEDVYTLGFPRNDVVFGEGSISALSGFRENPNAYQVSVPVNPGNSGGPLLNSKGDLIGMISGIQTQTAGAAFAIKSSVLLSSLADPALDSLTIPLILPKQNSLKTPSRVQQVKQWQDYVFMVRVY
ncbi:MAG TPA: serine protease [Cyclobacteriaceae bacterium]|nr:serine protease [Cyclobacteriaceae bacterium]